jgi:Short C-terminal domain/Phospholipase_D-nuclease N-terminal
MALPSSTTARAHHRTPDADTLGTAVAASQAGSSRSRLPGGPVVIAADYPLLDIIWTMLVFFGWVIWFWLLITVFADLFRRHDISGWGKAGWTLLLIVLPFLGVLIYMIAQGKEMAERSASDARARRGEFEEYVRDVAADTGPSDQIAKAKQLFDSGAIDQAEFDRIKQKALA